MFNRVLCLLLLTGLCQTSLAAKKEDTTYSNGKPQMTYAYQDDKLNGLSREFYENGDLKVESEYKMDKLVAQKKYRSDGKIEYDLKMKADRKYELTREFHPSGKLFRERRLVNGKRVGIEKEYYPSGKIKAERTYKKGKKQGSAKGYYENGKVQGDWQFKNGAPIAATIFYPSGEKHLIHEFENGRIHGVTKEYSKKGKLKAKRHYQHDKLIKRVRQ